jgi:hypothetical protein
MLRQTGRYALFLFEQESVSLGVDAVATHWIKLPPGTLEGLTLGEHVELFKSVPLEHPGKGKILERIKKMADSVPQRKDYYGCLGALHTSREVRESKKL